ncbi:MAG: hypothetical protein HY548_09200 [Elusimicrobia bacterium]|nr:hypothetical protein [Elusimicrobiota bacterium]
MNRTSSIKFALLIGAMLLLPRGDGVLAFSWTDPSLSTGSTRIRKVHIDELRANTNIKRVEFGFGNYTFTDATLTAGSTLLRKVHVDELRAAASAISNVYRPICPAYMPATPSWTNPTITAGSTLIRTAHVAELRTLLDGMGTCAQCCPPSSCKTGTCTLTGCGMRSPGSEGSPACAVCRDCNGSGSCTDVTSGTNDVGCDASGDCYTAPQTCNGFGGCNTNYRAEGTQYGGCDGDSSTACRMNACDGTGGCDTFYPYPNDTQDSTSPGLCNTSCHYCSSGSCTYLTSGQGYGCTSACQVCNASGNCVNDADGNACAGGTCCNGNCQSGSGRCCSGTWWPNGNCCQTGQNSPDCTDPAAPDCWWANHICWCDGSACNGTCHHDAGICCSNTWYAGGACCPGDNHPVTGDPCCNDHQWHSCCVNSDCSDGNPCTNDICSSYTCANTNVADETDCAGGTCCGGACQSGWDCCTVGTCGGCGSGTDCNLTLNIGGEGNYKCRSINGGAYSWTSGGDRWESCDESGELCATYADCGGGPQYCCSSIPNGWSVVAWSTCYRDADGDGYGNPGDSESQCCSSCKAGWVSNNSDCCDSDSNAKPGQANYYTAQNACGSWDYNCSGSVDKYYPNDIPTSCWGTCPSDCNTYTDPPPDCNVEFIDQSYCYCDPFDNICLTDNYGYVTQSCH